MRARHMNFSRRGFLLVAVGAAALTAISRAAWAQAYPSRPVRIIVPFAAGGGSDVIARLVAQKLTENLGRQFYVENQVGAGGNIGMGNAARATPDGYTILFATSSYVVNPSLYSKVPYDPDKDFAPLTVTADAANILLVHPLERFPKRLNREGFPWGHESDSRFVLGWRPGLDGEAAFGGFAV